MLRYRGNRGYRGVRSSPPPRQIATPSDTPAPDYGGWDPAAYYEWSAPISTSDDEWSAPMAMEDDGWENSEPSPETWKEFYFIMQKEKGKLDKEIQELKECLKKAPSEEEFIQVRNQLRKIEEENKQLHTEVTRAKEEVQSIAEERNNLRKELEVKLRL